MTINEFLVKRFQISYESAFASIREKRVVINGEVPVQKQVIKETDHIFFDDKEVQVPVIFQYIIYHKPRGVECTTNTAIEGNLYEALPAARGLYPVGRLDKESEGLLLLTNNGKWYQEIAGMFACKEKEYIVEVNKILSDKAIENLSLGVIIMGKQTLPAKVTKLDDYTFRITLIQGLNRQIRRMCYRIGYLVRSLKRVRIMSLELGDLKPGEYRHIDPGDIFR
ncbi:MAG: pseudouridine synthase [Cytophagaceae bacterium]|nr:pseudouridine synthase [Cytophagaceae bacterium]